MKKIVLTALIMLTSVMGIVTPLRSQGLGLTGGFTLRGSGGGPNSTNTIGAIGYIWGLSTGYYYYKLTRTNNGFDTQNFAISLDDISWVSPNLRALSGGTNPNNNVVRISGYIPDEALCGSSETIKIDIYNHLTQIASTHTLTILNPIYPAPVSSFSIAVNGHMANAGSSVINIDMISSTSITLESSPGNEVKYRLYVTKAKSNGTPISGGPSSDNSWHQGHVPNSINLRTLSGGTFIQDQIFTAPGFYLITLEKAGWGCFSGGASPFTMLIRTQNKTPINRPRQKAKLKDIIIK